MHFLQVRSYSSTQTRPLENVNTSRSSPTAIPIPSTSTAGEHGESSVTALSTPTSSSQMVQSIEETPRERGLKRKLFELQHRDLAKSKEIRRMQKQFWHLKRKISSLQTMTADLKKRNMILEEQEYLLLEHFGENKEIIQRLFQKQQEKSVTKKYEQSVRSFAITLHFYSPKAYNYVRQKFRNCLPHPKTLCKWYSTVNAKPGFSVESFNFLKLKVSHSVNPLVCCIIFDEMAIRQHLEFDGDNVSGYVDFGNGLHGDCVDVAKEALVFMLVCINEPWKIPLGYFFAAGVNSEQKASLTKQCLSLLHEIPKLVITSVTFDGCPANLSMCKLLGCSLIPTNIFSNFQHENKKTFILPDPAHMVKLIRNCFGELGQLIHDNDDIIDFNFIIKLNELQESEGLHLGNKLRSQHVKFFKQKMKVKLATQLLSRSVADALIYCADKLRLADFENCHATAQFIYIINDSFDILNSRSITLPKFKKAACKSNIDEIKLFYNNLKTYFGNLKLSSGTNILNSNRKTGFLGFLVGFETLLGMWNEYVELNKYLSYISMYKFSQDHIELFFGAIRSHGGHNNNPTCKQFTTAYKKILIHAEIRDRGAGNCIPLEDIQILNVASSKEPYHIINDSLSKQTLIGEIGEITGNDSENTNFLDDHSHVLSLESLSQYSSEIVIYIAGFVVFKLEKKIKCETCLTELYGEKDRFLNSLIYQKSFGKLSYPSDDVIEICMKTEKLLKVHRISNTKINKEKIIMDLFKYFHNVHIFVKMPLHDDAIASHHFLLLKSVANVYLDTRIHFICKSSNFHVEKIRNMYTKIIQFKGQ